MPISSSSLKSLTLLTPHVTFVGWRRCSIRRNIFISCSSILSLIWRSIWSLRPHKCQHNRYRACSTRSCRHWSTCTQGASSIEIWNPRTYSLIQQVPSWSLQISVLPALSGYQLRHIHMRLSLYGTDALRFSWDRSSTLLESTCGQLDAFSQRWLRDARFLWAIVKSIKYSKSSKF